jgi:phosphinothricin acetyltransferase
MAKITVRRATSGDLEDITRIYNEAILHTVATFDMEPKTMEEQEDWYEAHGPGNPIMVAVVEGGVVGWAALSRWSDRCAYSGTAEISLYIDEEYRGRGIGRRLMEAILEEGRRSGLHAVVARVAGGNEVSIHLHESLGFEPVGVMREAGRKFDRWLDVYILQKRYREPVDGERADVRSWRGKALGVRVLFSKAGTAQSIQVSHGEGFLLVDAGDGTLRDLLAREGNIREINGIAFTHGHFDHVGGLYPILGFLRMVGREDDLHIIAPGDCKEVQAVVEAFRSCYLDTTPFRISVREARSRQVFQVGGMSIRAFPVVHCGSTKGAGILGPIPAAGYRLSFRGETVAVSGDTGDCPSLRELVRGADLAVLEATYPDRWQVEGAYLERVHLSTDLALEIGRSARECILVHGRR